MGPLRRKFVALTLVVLLGGYGLLLIPAPSPPPPAAPPTTPFRWNQDERWFALEERFKEARALGCLTAGPRIDASMGRGHDLIARVAARAVGPEAGILDTIEDHLFQLGPMVGACLHRLPDYVQFVTRTRSVIKRQSERWDMSARATKNRLYRLLWGGRAALEEVMLQGPADSLPALVVGDEEPSRTPSARILGATVHSGDLLVSRAGAPSSALIAIGNDYPGNFSHVALIYVDQKTSVASVIQSNQNGLRALSLEDYLLRDVKLRVMVLRLRADLPLLVTDPMLPHEAALRALRLARTRHTPYDFEIDHHDASKMYCSEVPAHAYEELGVRLWMQLSRISALGTRAWLTALGVKGFEAQEPSDLEYDPQLRVVAEWRDPETLYLDHVDNVVTEAMLDGANKGERLLGRWYLLPFVRVVKGYSAVLNLFGRVGPVPEGLSATVALRVLELDRRHASIKKRVLQQADEFRRREGYVPPEWKLLRFAKQAREELR